MKLNLLIKAIRWLSDGFFICHIRKELHQIDILVLCTTTTLQTKVIDN